MGVKRKNEILKNSNKKYPKQKEKGDREKRRGSENHIIEYARYTLIGLIKTKPRNIRLLQKYRGVWVES